MSESTIDLSKATQDLVGLIATQPGAVVSRVLVNKPAGTVTLFAFDVGQGLSEHTAPYEALVHILAGEADVRIAAEDHRVSAGHILLLPANIPHAIQAHTEFKMLLTMIRA
ncbi:MAG: cupin domain-containing protein [Anaerolineales bacterium]